MFPAGLRLFAFYKQADKSRTNNRQVEAKALCPPHFGCLDLGTFGFWDFDAALALKTRRLRTFRHTLQTAIR